MEITYTKRKRRKNKHYTPEQIADKQIRRAKWREKGISIGLWTFLFVSVGLLILITTGFDPEIEQTTVEMAQTSAENPTLTILPPTNLLPSPTLNESEPSTVDTTQSCIADKETETEPEPEPTEDPAPEPMFTEEDAYLLAKIAMAEAEGESTFCKACVIRVVLNRVESSEWPNTIKDVIFQTTKSSSGKTIYQFSPIGDGRWDMVEPDEDSWDALRLVMTGWDLSQEALFFRSHVNKETWHSRNLTFLFTEDRTDFYR